MEAFWKAVAVTILTILLGTTIAKSEKDIALALTVSACCIVIISAMRYLSDVIVFLWKLGSTGDYQNPFMDTLLKITGIALVTELTGLLSSDAGNSSLGKAMQILGNAAILFLSLPIFETFITTIQEIMRLA